MEKSFRLRIERGSSSKTNWFYDTIFTIHENEKRIDVSDGDCDSHGGDVEEWDFVDYETIPHVNELFKDKYPNLTEDFLSDEQKKFYDEIGNKDVKQLFLYLVCFCTNDKGSMSSFKELLDENNIKNEYSKYFSSEDW